MAKEHVDIMKQFDWLTAGLVLLLMVFGALSICSADYNFEEATLFSYDTRAGKQIIWIVCSLGVASLIMLCNQNFLRTYSYVIFTTLMVLLVVTILIASDTKGSRSWLKLGPVSLQPAEFAKFATALALARFLDDYEFNPRDFRSLGKAIGIFMLPMVLIVAQNETGSALVYLAFFLVLFREGMSGMIIFSGFCAILFFVLGLKYWETPFLNMPFTVGPMLVMTLIQMASAAIAWLYITDDAIFKKVLAMGVGSTFVGLIISLYIIPFRLPVLQILSIVSIAGFCLYQTFMNKLRQCLLIAGFALCSTVYLYSCNYVFDKVMQPHQQVRINVILGVEDDPWGAGYNVNQSKIAIGSGGLLGKGFLKGTQTKLKYVPEQYTDFIFCTVGEEKGFVGTTVVLLLFGGLILRLIFLAERQSSVFGRVLGYSVSSILFMHLLINIGMVLGITPVIGIPLPFFSYGGSSLWGFTFLLFIFLRVDAERTSRF